jgi:hypothetical protein
MRTDDRNNNENAVTTELDQEAFYEYCVNQGQEQRFMRT